jgi:hypothetical protein
MVRDGDQLDPRVVNGGRNDVCDPIDAGVNALSYNKVHLGDSERRR